MQKAVNDTLKGRLLQDERRPFATSLIISKLHDSDTRLHDLCLTKSYCGACLGQPGVVFAVERRREAVEDGLVVAVEPRGLFSSKHVADYRRGVYRTERERLELEEPAELRLLVRHD